MGASNWLDQDCYQEGFGKAACVTSSIGDHFCGDRGDP